MLRPLTWIERIEAKPNLKLELGVFSADGTQISTTQATEEFPGRYRAKVALDKKYSGATYVLRWRLAEEPWTQISALVVFVTGERLPEDAVSVLVGKK